MQVLDQQRDSDALPLRVTHNDTKLSNMLFSPSGTGLCMIDLDTVMPGLLHYDFGDAVRVLCNSGAEDEPDTHAIQVRLDYFEAFTHGMFGQSGFKPRPEELAGLSISPAVMAFIVGLRMLTDFLEGDRYFSTAYPGHNLVRTRAQFTLARRFLAARPPMQASIEHAIQSTAASGRTG
jgi:hypothetical protein